jgi:hypothetical protein
MRIVVLAVVVCIALRAGDRDSPFTGVWIAKNVRNTPVSAPDYLLVTLDESHEQLTLCSLTRDDQTQRLRVREFHALQTVEVVKLDNSEGIDRDVVLIAGNELTFRTNGESGSSLHEHWRLTLSGNLIINTIRRAAGHKSRHRSVYQRAAVLP